MRQGDPAPRPADEVRGSIEEILGRAEFQPREPTWLERVFDWLGENVSLPSPPAGVADFVMGLAIVAMVVALGIAGYKIGQALRRPGAKPAGPEDIAWRERVAELRRRSRAAREAGDLALALRLSFWALAIGLGRLGNLEYRSAWTNRELARRGGASPELASMLEQLVSDLDRKVFGREPATEADVDEMERLCDRWIGGGA